MRLLGLTVLILASLLLTPAFAQDDEAADSEAAVKHKPTYFEIKPAFVVNYGGPGRLRYIKTSLTLRVDGDIGMRGIRHHLPQIRDVIVMTLTKQSEEDISSMEGKELVRLALLEAVQNVLAVEEGKHYISDLLFNSFIVQR
mgnify:CR=1 FL=1